MQGGTPLMMNYGINTLANKFNKYAGSNDRLDYDEGLSDWGSPMGPVPDAPSMPPMLDQTGQMGASNYRAPQGIPFNPDQGNRGRWDQQNVPDKKGFSFNPLNWGIGGMMKKAFEPNTPEENFGRKYFEDRNTLSSSGRTYGNQAYDVFAGKNVASAFGQGMGGAAQKRIDRINKTLSDWEAKAAEGDEDAIQRLKTTTLRRRSDEFKKQLAQYNKDLAAGTGGADTTGGYITKTTPDGGGYTGPRTYDFDRAAFQRSGGQRASRDGFTDPGRGSYGPHMAYGGRIGYQEGELVEDESMMEAAPGGMMEENIEEVQGEPSREQLEAIAFEIFQLPLEELNEEQLEVVYQAAMEQEPSEEEVQFAAQEGPGEGIASLV